MSISSKAGMAALALATAFSATACTDAGMAKMGGLGESAKIDVYSGGQLIQSFVSTGKVGEESGSGYYFRDKATDKLIEVNGDIVITYDWEGGPSPIPGAACEVAPQAPVPGR